MDQHLDSILNSSRRFDLMEVKDVSLKDEELIKLQKIAERHGSTIKELTLYLEEEGPIFGVDAKLFRSFLKKLPHLLKWNVVHKSAHDVKFRGDIKPTVKLESFSLSRTLPDKIKALRDYSEAVGDSSDQIRPKQATVRSVCSRQHADD